MAEKTFITIAVTKYHGQKQVGKEPVYVVYTFTSQPIRKSGQELKWSKNWRQELMHSAMGGAAYQHGLLGLLSHRTRVTSPEAGPPMMG